VKVDLQSVLTLIGVQSNCAPTMVACPICGASGKCFIKHAGHVTCQACWSSGDIVMFYAAKASKTLPDAVRELQSRSLLDLQGEKLEAYVSNCQLQITLFTFLREKGFSVRQGIGGGASAVLDNFGVRYTDRAYKLCCPHIVPFSAMDMDTYGIPVIDASAPTLKWLGKYAGWAMPAWHGPWIGGLWVITVKGVEYLPIRSDSRSYASGTAIINSYTEQVTVLDSPLEAFRLMMLSAAYDNVVHPYIVPVGITDAVDLYRTQRVVFWSPDREPAWLARAMAIPDVYAVDHLPKQDSYRVGGNFPYKGSHALLQANLNSLKETPHKAFAQCLLRLPAEDARKALAGMKIEQGDRAKMLSSQAGARHSMLADLLRGSVSERSAIYDGHVITETAQGWICKGKLVSDAMFYMDEIHPLPDGDATIQGTVVHAGIAYPFQDSLGNMRKKPGAWLLTFLVSTCGRMPTIAKAWESKLFDISQAFKQPVPIKLQPGNAWVDGALHLPNFSIDKHGIYKAANVVSGPRLPMPDGKVDMLWATNETACKLWLGMAGNLIRTHLGKLGHGMIVVNQGALVSRIAQVLGTDVVRNPTNQQLSAMRIGALPTCIECDEAALTRLCQWTEGHNVIVSLPTHLADLVQLQGTWQRIDVGIRPVDVDVLATVFTALPTLLGVGVVANEAMFYRKLVAPILAEIKRPGTGGVRSGFTQAAAEFDVINTDHSFASKLMLYLTGQAAGGKLPTTPVGESVQVELADIGTLLGQGVVPMPPLRDMVQALIGAGFVVDSLGGMVQLAGSAWAFYQSTAKALA